MSEDAFLNGHKVYYQQKNFIIICSYSFKEFPSDRRIFYQGQNILFCMHEMESYQNITININTVNLRVYCTKRRLYIDLKIEIF